MTGLRLHSLEEVAADLAHRLARTHAAAGQLRQVLGLAELHLQAGDPEAAAPYLEAAVRTAAELAGLSTPAVTIASGQLALPVPVDVAHLARQVEALDRPAPFHRDGPIAEVFAALRRPPRGGQRRRVLEAIAAAGPAGVTDAELEDRLALARPSPGNRRGELVADGLVEATGAHRPTRTGTPATVWRLTPTGSRVAAYLHDKDAARA